MADTQTDDFLTPKQPLPWSPTPPGSDSASVAPTQSQPQQPPSGPAQADIDKMVQSRGQNTDQLISAITKLGEDRNKLLNEPTPHPPQPKFQDIPKPPQDNYRSAITDSKDGLIFATLLGSLFTRQHALGAMEAATGYMTGFEKGDKEKIERDRQKWNDNVEQVVKQNQVEQERYNAVWNDTKISQADKQSKLLAIASSVGDQQTIASLKNGNMDFAYQLQKDRNMAVEKIYEAQLKAGLIGGGGQISEQALHTMVDQYLAGDKSVLQNIGRGAQGARNIAAFRNQLAETMEQRGITGEQQARKMQQYQADTAGLSAGERTGATQAANLQIIVRNAYAAIPQAIEASEKVPRGKFVPLNQLYQKADASISDPNLLSFKQANLQLAELWARAMNPKGVMRESDRDMALSILGTATSKESYKVATDNLKKFLEREQKSVESFQKGEPMEPQVPTDDGGWKIERVE